MENQIEVNLKDVSDRGLDVLVAMALGLDVQPSYYAWMRKVFTAQGMSPVRIDQHLAFSCADHPYIQCEGRADPLPYYSTDWNAGGWVIDNMPNDAAEFVIHKGTSALRQMMQTFVSYHIPGKSRIDAAFEYILK